MDSTVAEEMQGVITSVVTPEKNATLDFSQVSCSQLGISPQSFVLSAKAKDKSRLSKLKVRRRSSVGVRGSPETNALIRFIAQKRRQTPPSTPQNLQIGSFVQRSFSTLKQKMVSFQSLLEVDDEMPREENQKEGDGSAVATKENVDPLGCLEYARPPPSKKYCLESVQCKKVPSMLTACNSSLTLSTARLKQLEVTKELSSECTELDDAIYQSSADSPMLSTSSDSGQTQCQPATEQQVCPSGVQNYESSSVPLHSAPDASDIQPVLFISPLAKHPTDEVACSGDPSRNKKRVRFGAPLSPEFFDKNLPPSTPLQKGGTPAHASTSAGPQLRPLLKTPQRSTSHFPQPDFTSPVMGDLPTSSEGPGCAEAQFDPGEHQDENGQEMTLPVATEKTYDKILTSTDMASQVCIDSNVQCTSEPLETHPSPLHDSLSGIETETVPPCALEPLLCTAAPAAVPTCSRKRKASTNVVVKKRTSRNAAISAAKKLCKKSSSGKKRWGNKEVDRSLYGKRDYASKNPALSPITEALSSASRSPTPQRHHSGNRLLEDDICAVAEAPRTTLKKATCTNFTSAAVAAAAQWRQRFCLLSVKSSAQGQLTETPQEADHPESMADRPQEVETLLQKHKVVQLPGTEQQDKRSGSGGRRRGRGRGKARGGLQRSSLPAVGDGEKNEKADEHSSGDLVDHSGIRAGPSLCRPPIPSLSPGNSPKHVADSSPAPPSCVECTDEGMKAASDLSRERGGHTRTPTDHNSLARCEPNAKVACESDVEFSLQSASEGELMASVDEKTIPNKKSGAQGRVRGRRSSRVQPSLILDEAVVLGTQVDASAAELVNSVEPKGPEDPNVLGREMRKEGLLAQGCDLEKSAGKTEKSSSSVDQVPCGNCSLPEWAQFSIEDVLQPLPRTQRCVRRSLRNQCSADSAEAGLAWVLHVSPAPSKPLHRRTKGCPTPTCPEEPAL
ncbi:cell division cycle-associated protein 2 isoform X1 [Scleropages formosus]|uniref:Uncharacterized LOC108940374 n=1 Tax=Scleropages formosus TaxID=113540 RepID=A0A8C9S1B7_SCLFO|nr:uncharacterized protein LOC108940374 isoform X1 [Scleropages formosus]